MLKSVRQFYIFSLGLALLLALAIGVVLLSGDPVGQPITANFAYLPENKNGVPEISIAFEGKDLPTRNVIEQAIITEPALTGDSTWDGKVLHYTLANPPTPDTSYRVAVRGGLDLSQGGRTVYQPLEWSFKTHPAHLIYLKREGQAVNLWQAQADGSAERSLTSETDRQVLEFSVSPGGERLVYSLQEPDARTAGLWLLDLSGNTTSPKQLVFEKNIRATAPKWSPGGDLIAYERRLLFEKDGFAPSQLWLVQPDGTYLPPIYGGGEKVGVGLAWNAGGSKAAFWDPRKEAVGIYNFSGEPEWLKLPGIKIDSLALSPDGQSLIIAHYDYSGATEKELLESWQYKNKEGWKRSALQPPVSNDFNDRKPAWSPDGRLLAFIRQQNKAGQILSSQVWLFDPASGESRPTSEGTGLTGNFQWNPDSQKLVMDWYPLNGKIGSSNATILGISLKDKSVSKLINGGFMPGLFN